MQPVPSHNVNKLIIVIGFLLLIVVALLSYNIGKNATPLQKPEEKTLLPLDPNNKSVSNASVSYILSTTVKELKNVQDKKQLITTSTIPDMPPVFVDSKTPVLINDIYNLQTAQIGTLANITPGTPVALALTYIVKTKTWKLGGITVYATPSQIKPTQPSTQVSPSSTR